MSLVSNLLGFQFLLYGDCRRIVVADRPAVGRGLLAMRQHRCSVEDERHRRRRRCLRRRCLRRRRRLPCLRKIVVPIWTTDHPDERDERGATRVAARRFTWWRRLRNCQGGSNDNNNTEMMTTTTTTTAASVRSNVGTDAAAPLRQWSTTRGKRSRRQR